MRLKKSWSIALAAGALACTSLPGYADVIKHLTEAFQSGASFSGDLTFSDDFSQLLSGTGTLTGGTPSPDSLTWIWYGGASVDRGNGVFSDFLMFGGSAGGSWNQFIEIAWTDTGGGNLVLVEDNLGSLGNGGDSANSIDYRDPMVSGRFSNVQSVPEPMTAGLVGLGLLCLGALRGRRRV